MPTFTRPQPFVRVLAAAVVAMTLRAAASPPVSPPAPAPAIDEAIARLVAEAERAKGELALPVSKPEFARRFARADEVDDDAVLRRLVQPVHADPFVDAYVRWQLTSFEPAWPDLDDGDFARLMSRAPKLVPNPRAEERTRMIAGRAETTGRLSEHDTRWIRDYMDELARRAEIAATMNRPALGFRDWVASKLGVTGPRPRQWLVERCAATVQAGWPPRAAKSKLTRALNACYADVRFTPREREMVAAQVRRLETLPETAFIESLTVHADGSVAVKRGTVAIRPADVEQWTAAVRRTAPPPA